MRSAKPSPRATPRATPLQSPGVENTLFIQDNAMECIKQTEKKEPKDIKLTREEKHEEKKDQGSEKMEVLYFLG